MKKLLCIFVLMFAGCGESDTSVDIGTIDAGDDAPDAETIQDAGPDAVVASDQKDAG